MSIMRCMLRRDSPASGGTRPHVRVRRAGVRAGSRVRLVAALVTLVMAVGACLGVSIAAVATGSDAAPLRSSTSSTLGIFVENGLTDEEMQEADIVGNDSNLGIFVTSAVSEDITVTFMTQGAVYETVKVGYGYVLSAPAASPEWAGSWEGDGDDPPAPKPVFGGWCIDEAGSVAYDFSYPVTREMTLYASWDTGTKVNVTLHALGGELDDPTGLPDKLESLTLARYVSSPYRSLPTPARTGYTFSGWWSEDGRQTGAWGTLIEASTVVGNIAKADHDLYAKWQANGYFVRYVNNTDLAGGGAQHEASATYDVPHTLLTWSEVQRSGFYVPSGKAFQGWNTRPDGSGTSYEAGAAVTNLATDEGAYVALYAEWVGDGTIDPGPFDVTFVYDDGATEDVTVTVERGQRVPEPTMPKRTGYQFAGWLTSTGAAWSFDTPVFGHLTLRASWTLRLDVTVPASVGLAVDAASGAVSAPEMGAYALKSRTVAPVEVTALSLRSEQAELDGFFELTEEARSWKEALGETRLSLRADVPGAAPVSLALAGDADAGGVAWRSAYALTDDERAAYRLGAFSYAGVAFDDTWEGGDPSERLPLELAMTISSQLSVRNGIAGAVPITHLMVTVSAQA